MRRPGRRSARSAPPLLRQFLVKRDGKCTVEDVVSGPGLVNVYQFVRAHFGAAPAEAGAPGAGAVSSDALAPVPEVR